MDKEDSEESDNLFVVDTIPTIRSDVPVPRYKSKFQVLSDTPDEYQSASKKARRLNSCFNCGSCEHAIRDCTEPRDGREIARNRKIFMDTKSSKNDTNNGVVFQRYHVDYEQKFAHFKPGTISKDLRFALGITSYELPPYIYNMRKLGYPLGWLEEIKVSHSGISMFDGNGKEVVDPDDEEGEVIRPEDRDKYDIRKIISYPGFNVPPSSKVFDEYERFDAPPLNACQSKEALIEALENKSQNSYQRKKLARFVKKEQIDDNTQSHTDMDCEDIPEVGMLPEDNCRFVPPLPDIEIVPPPPPPEDIPTLDDNSVESISNQSMGDDLSLQDLESKKIELLAELNDTSCSNITPHKNLGKIKTVELGTPVLKSVSPYSRLPSPKSFSVDICDVINFENLPDSTGKYKKISGVIRKVRTEVLKLQAVNR